jgi:hypothetical protein
MAMAQQEIPTKSVASNVIRGSLGNLIEWYDWYAYAAFSVYFASAFLVPLRLPARRPDIPTYRELHG